MKHLIFLLLYTSYVFSVLAQKPALDTSAFKKWAAVGGGAISNDGNYVSYYVNNQPFPSRKLVLQSTQNDWKKEFIGASTVKFTNDSKYIIFKTGKDSLCVLGLGKEDLIWISHVSGYDLPKDDQGDWLLYRPASQGKEVVLLNLASRQEQHFSSVTHYLFTDNGKNLLLETQVKKDSSIETCLQWMNLASEETRYIWPCQGHDGNPVNYAFNDQGDRLAFMVEKKKDNLPVYELWYYKLGIDSAVSLVNDATPSMGAGLVLANQTPEFSEDGTRIFFGLRPLEQRRSKPGAAQVDVWSYTDTELQSLQLATLNQGTGYSAVIDIQEKKVIWLQQKDERMVARSNSFVLVMHSLGNYGIFEAGWNSAAEISYWLVSIRDGSRKLVKDHITNDHDKIGLSPGGRWIIYYDFRQRDYFSYEIATGITQNITKGIHTKWADEDNDNPDNQLAWEPGRPTWLWRDGDLLINDSYDIWRVDPSGLHPPLSLTNGYGRRHQIKFEWADEGSRLSDTVLQKEAPLVLTAFNTINKDRGFYRKAPDAVGNPDSCIMGPFVFGRWEGDGTYNFPPSKAKKADSYLVFRMSAVEAPNYWVTHDFKHFLALSDVQPQKDYNWMNTKLVHWKTLDGSPSSGILYMPENFDPQKKYSLIFDYYERRSDELNLYIRPMFSENRINIPWYVSHGYLVFTPDIHYKKGQPGQSAYNSIVSAALYLARKPWVDAHKMGIQGHSFGGYETNYIVTHSKLFAAACSASGISDLMSWYGSTPRGGFPVYWAERSQGRMGATPWQIQKLYISNSPIFKADQVSTPLLMMNNSGDRTVPFAQGVEFFTALRRLGKKVWMLQYDEGAHSVGRGEGAEDYSIRMTQFFDHYLKGAPAPKWMTRGIPARLKGIDDGLELDGEIPTPGMNLNTVPSGKKLTKNMVGRE